MRVLPRDKERGECPTFAIYPIQMHCVKVAVNRNLQKFMRGLSIFYLYTEVSTVSFAILYCRTSLVLLSQQIS